MAKVKFVTSNGTGEEARKIECEFDFGDNLQDAIDKFGEEVIFDNFVAAARVDVQGMIRRKMNGKVSTGEGENKVDRDYTDEEITAVVAEWHPTKRGQRASADPMAKAEKLLDTMSAAQIEELKVKLIALTAGS